MTQDSLCPMLQWWVQGEMARPGFDPRATFVAARYSDMPARAAGPRGSADYPPSALEWGIEGEILVRGRTSAEGLRDAVVVKRVIRVPGVDDQPLVAFERVFDNASLARAAQARSEEPPGQEATVTIVWKLAP
jgi:outer membrane biosynthesis protein TonB